MSAQNSTGALFYPSCQMFLKTLMVVIVHRLIIFSFLLKKAWKSNFFHNLKSKSKGGGTLILCIVVKNKKYYCLVYSLIAGTGKWLQTPSPPPCAILSGLSSHWSRWSLEKAALCYTDSFVDLLLNGYYPVVMYGWKLWLEKKILIV